MRVLFKEPNKPLEERELKGSLQEYQKIVGGYIETTMLTNEIIIIVNEEGKLEGLPYNFSLPHDHIVGTAIFIGNAMPEFRGLTDEEVEFITNQFS